MTPAAIFSIFKLQLTSILLEREPPNLDYFLQYFICDKLRYMLQILICNIQRNLSQHGGRSPSWILKITKTFILLQLESQNLPAAISDLLITNNLHCILARIVKFVLFSSLLHLRQFRLYFVNLKIQLSAVLHP